MAILLYVDHDRATLSPQVAKALTAALAIGGDVHALVAGEDVRAVAEQARTLMGVSKVLLAEAPQVGGQLAEAVAALIASLAPGYDTIVAAATSNGKNILPRVAALLDVMQISDILEVVAPDTFKRPIYAGSAIQTVRSRDDQKVITVRTAAFAAAGAGGMAEMQSVAVPAVPPLSKLIGNIGTTSDRVDLESASIVVSGGRAFGSKEKFEELLVPLADKLGAALGASRAAVDAGYAPNDWQVGQTGKSVAPVLYLAIGISGAVQHLAGIKEAKIIVAINKDGDAPIFGIADYGLVGDLFTILPELQRAL